MLPGLLLKGKHLCHVTIKENGDVRVNIHDKMHGRGVCLLAIHAHFTSFQVFLYIVQRVQDECRAI